MNEDISKLLITNSVQIHDLYSESITTRKADGSFLNRLVCQWNEITPSKDIQQHIYTAGIDKNDGVYLDCRKRLIFAKILVSTAFRPLRGFVKTLYHLSMIPIAKAIFTGIQGKMTAKEVGVKSAQSIADIVRTPVYELAMVIVGLAGIITAFVAPTTLYKFREAIGKIEGALFREKFHPSTMAPCFQSRDLKDMVEIFAVSKHDGRYYLRNNDDTNYGEFSVENLLKAKVIDEVKQGSYKIKKLSDLNKVQKVILRDALVARSTIQFARAMIKTQRKHYNPFYKVFGKLSPKTTYKSPAHAQMIKDEKKAKPKKQVKFAEVVEYNLFDHKPVNFNDAYVHRKPKTLKRKLTIKKSFINKMHAELKEKLKIKTCNKRIRYLINCLANGFEDRYAESLIETAETKGTALKNYEKDLTRILDGVTNSTLTGKALRRDGYALLPIEIMHRDLLKEIALKHAKALFSKPFTATNSENIEKKAETSETHSGKASEKKHKHHHRSSSSRLQSVRTEANLFEAIEKQKKHRKHHTKKVEVAATETTAVKKHRTHHHHEHRKHSDNVKSDSGESTKKKHHKHKKSSNKTTTAA